MNPLKNPLSGLGALKAVGGMSPVGGASIAKTILKKRKGGGGVAVNPGAMLG